MRFLGDVGYGREGLDNGFRNLFGFANVEVFPVKLSISKVFLVLLKWLFL